MKFIMISVINVNEIYIVRVIQVKIVGRNWSKTQFYGDTTMSNEMQ